MSISDIKDVPTLAALFEVDSNYGRWPEEVTAKGSCLVVGGREIPVLRLDEGAAELEGPWCRSRDRLHRAGVHASRCPGPSRCRRQARPDQRAEQEAGRLRCGTAAGHQPRHVRPGKHKIVSLASCTTNALAPVVKVVIENFGIKYGLFSTIHAYTNSQALTDQPMKDRRDSWAATENIIPSSSGAARALAFVWEGLKISGKAYRVPTRTGSIAELSLLTERSVTVEQVNAAFRKAAAVPPLKGVMSVLEDEWASSRIVGDPHSSIVDLPLTAIEGDLLSVAAWYDNEMGYSTRLAEMAAHIVA